MTSPTNVAAVAFGAASKVNVQGKHRLHCNPICLGWKRWKLGMPKYRQAWLHGWRRLPGAMKQLAYLKPTAGKDTREERVRCLATGTSKCRRWNSGGYREAFDRYEEAFDAVKAICDAGRLRELALHSTRRGEQISSFESLGAVEATQIRQTT